MTTNSQYTMTIDGKAVKGTTAGGVINPATGQVFAHVPECTKGELDLAMEAAVRAAKTWAKDILPRKQALHACAARIRENANGLAMILTQEQGKPLPDAKQEVGYAAAWFDYTATLDLPVELIQDDATRRVEVRRRPLGVVAAITPWNFPLVLAAWKIAPALLAGNTVVLKPSPFTPISTLMIAEMLRDVLPNGVLNAVSGGADVGAAMTHHPVPRKVSFTGSVGTGKSVMAAAAEDLKRVTLELGGNDAAIVLGDVDPKVAAAKIFWTAFANNGQFCCAIKRVYAHESIYRRLVEELALVANSVKVGNGLTEGVQLGPINNAPQLERVSTLVDDARAHGAKIVTGGARIGNEGYFYAPTIVSDIDDAARLVAEEQFGPALPVMMFGRVEDAVQRANATTFGLAGSVWSRDVQKATEIAGQLECGSAWVNQHCAMGPMYPFGGAKWSGIGVENGSWGLHEYTQLQVVNAAKD